MIYGNRFCDDPSYSVAVNICENCGKPCDELIDLPIWNFKACPTCADDAAREDAREAAEHMPERRSAGQQGASRSDQQKSA